MNSIPEKKYRIAVIVVSWNRKELLRRCLSSLHSHFLFSRIVLVIDNASTDGTPDMIRNNFPDVYLFENDRNLGFSKAVNQGLAYLKLFRIRSDYVLLLNNDAYFVDDSFAGMLDYLDRKNNVLAALPAVFVKDKNLQTGVGGYDLSVITAFNYFFGLSMLFPTLFKGFFFNQDFFYRKKKVLELDWISGVCLVLKSALIGRIPRLPEEFFMYAEDTALCRKIRKFGKIVYYPKARVVHSHGDYKKDEESLDPALWLSSLFEYCRNKELPGVSVMKVFLLKLVFMGGFFLRWTATSLFPGIRAGHSVPADQFKLYFASILQNLFERRAK